MSPVYSIVCTEFFERPASTARMESCRRKPRTAMPDTKPPTPEPPKHRPRRGILTIAGAVFALLVAALAVNFFRDVPLRISKETTYITEPLTSDGKWVDYFTAVEQMRYPPEMRTDENGARLIVRALGPDPDLTPSQRQQVYEKLGLIPTTPTLKYEEPYEAIKSHVEALAAAGKLPEGKTADEYRYELDDLLGRPWTTAELPVMQTWLDDNGPALDLLSEAARQRLICFPDARESESDPLIGIGLESVQRLRGFVRGLAARALYRIANADIDRAIDDILTIDRLGRHLQSGGYAFGYLVGIALETVGRSIGIAADLEHPPSDEQLRRFVSELNHLPQPIPVEACMELERFVELDAIQTLARGDRSLLSAQAFWTDEPLVPGYQAIAGFDWNVVMQRANSNFDNLLHDRPLPTPIPSWQGLLRGPRSLQLADAMTRDFAFWPNIQEAFHKSDCQEHLQRITLAMLLYERKHGRLPPAHTVDATGNPLQSWRVLLLPYLGEADLFDNIRREEPWDSEHNRQFHAAAPEVYQCPSHQLPAGETIYAVVVGPTAPFDAGVGKPLADFGPGSADMLLVVERNTPANWMDPTQEVPLATAKLGINQDEVSELGLGSVHPGGMLAGLRSGGVTFLSENIDITTTLPAYLEGREAEPSE